MPTRRRREYVRQRARLDFEEGALLSEPTAVAEALQLAEVQLQSLIVQVGHLHELMALDPARFELEVVAEAGVGPELTSPRDTTGQQLPAGAADSIVRGHGVAAALASLRELSSRPQPVSMAAEEAWPVAAGARSTPRAEWPTPAPLPLVVDAAVAEEARRTERQQWLRSKQGRRRGLARLPRGAAAVAGSARARRRRRGGDSREAVDSGGGGGV
jgi:hypothetical protein